MDARLALIVFPGMSSEESDAKEIPLECTCGGCRSEASDNNLASKVSIDCNICPKRATIFEKCWWYWGDSLIHEKSD